MFQGLLLIGCIIFLIVFVYSLQMRQRIYKNYTNSCDVLYYPEKEKILMIKEKEKIKFKPDESQMRWDLLHQGIQGF